jgi:hypothetical protein
MTARGHLITSQDVAPDLDLAGSVPRVRNQGNVGTSYPLHRGRRCRPVVWLTTPVSLIRRSVPHLIGVPNPNEHPGYTR